MSLQPLPILAIRIQASERILQHMHRAIPGSCQVSNTSRKVMINRCLCHFALNQARYKFETFCPGKRSSRLPAQISPFCLILFKVCNRFPGRWIIHLFHSNLVRVVLEYFCFGLLPQRIVMWVALTKGCISGRL